MCRCGRKVLQLFAPYRHSWRCRHCYDLTYATRQAGLRYRLILNAQKVRERLGGADLGVANPFPPKPSLHGCNGPGPSERAYLGRKPSFTRPQFTAVRQQLGQTRCLHRSPRMLGLAGKRSTASKTIRRRAKPRLRPGGYNSQFASWTFFGKLHNPHRNALRRSIIALTSGSISTTKISLSAVHCQNWKARRTGMGVRIDSKRSGVPDFGPDLVLFVNNHRSFTQLVAVSVCTSLSSEPLIWRFPSVGTS